MYTCKTDKPIGSWDQLSRPADRGPIHPGHGQRWCQDWSVK